MKHINRLALFSLLMAVPLWASCTSPASNSPVSELTFPAVNSTPTPSPESTPRAMPIRTPDRFDFSPGSEELYGLYYVKSKDGDDDRQLVISDDNQPIPQKPNDPDAATVPGFYMSRENRLDFKEIEINGNEVFFRTRELDGLSYEFRGTTGKEIVPDFSEDEPLPFIKGALKMIVNGRIVRSENIIFGRTFTH